MYRWRILAAFVVLTLFNMSGVRAQELANPDSDVSSERSPDDSAPDTQSDSDVYYTSAEDGNDDDGPDPQEAASEEAVKDPEDGDVPVYAETIPLPNKPDDVEPIREKSARPQALDDVIVTAQKRPQNLQEVSVSVSVITGEEIKARKINTLEQAMRTVPNVKVESGNFGHVSIRGMAPPTNANGQFDQSSAAIVDDVPMPLGFLGFAFLDAASIEVLRGPQGTLYGRNNVAGVLKLTTEDPTYDFNGFVSGQYGDYESYKLTAVANAPLWEDVAAARFKLTRERDLGYVYNTTLDVDSGFVDRSMYGVKLGIDFGSGIELITNVLYGTLDHLQGWSFQAVECPDDYLTLGRQFDPDFECNPDQTSSEDYRDAGQDADAVFANSVLNWDLDDGYVLKGLVSYYDFETFTRVDADNSPMPLLTAPLQADGQSYSAELRLLSPDIDLWTRPLNFVSGLYYALDAQTIDFVLNFVPLCVEGVPLASDVLAPLLAPLLDLSEGLPQVVCDGRPTRPPSLERIELFQDKAAQELGVFAQAEYEVLDDLKATAGLRYSSVDTTAKRVSTSNYCLGAQAQCILGTGGNIGNRSVEDVTRTDTAISFKAALGYSLTSNVNTYVSVASGFKAGGFGLNVYEDDEGRTFLDEYEPEHSVNYEFGLKTKFLDGRGRANLALFWTDYTDYQVLQQTELLGAELTNAARSRARGAELETAFVLPTDSGVYRLSANGGYLDARYLQYPGATCPPQESGEDADNDPSTPPLCDLSGRRLAHAPKWKAAALLDAEWPLFDWPVLLSAGFEAAWQDMVFFQSNTDPVAVQEAYWRLNARLALRSPEGRWTLSGFVENLADTRSLQQVQPVPAFAGVYGGHVSRPRWWTVAATWTF